MTLLVKKLDDRAIIPTRGSVEAIGADLYALEDIIVKPGEVTAVRTGIAIAFPPAFYARIAPRSGLAARWGIDTLAGVVDADYRGEVGVIVVNLGAEPVTIERGERIAQLVVAPVVRAAFEPEPELNGTARGEGGFGSTGTA